MTIDDKEVLEIRPDYARDPDVAGTRFSRIARAGQARGVGFFPGKQVIHTLYQSFVLRGAQIEAFEKFFNDRAGKWGRCLVPSWVYELPNGTTNSTGSSSGQPNLRIDWTDYANEFDPTDTDLSKLGHYVFIFWPSDGTLFVSKVTAVASSSEGVHDTITLATNLPKAVVADHSQIIGFAYDVRFLSDELELDYSGLDTALAEMAFVEHVTSTPEADVT